MEVNLEFIFEHRKKLLIVQINVLWFYMYNFVVIKTLNLLIPQFYEKIDDNFGGSLHGSFR